MSIPIKIMLMPLQRNILEIDTSNTTQFDGEYNFLHRGDNYMKKIEIHMNVKIKIDSFNFVYGVNGGSRFYKFQIKWLNKHKHAWIGDIISMVNRLRLESNYEQVKVLDVNIKKVNKLKQSADLVSRSKLDKSDESEYDLNYNNLYGLLETASDYSDFM